MEPWSSHIRPQAMILALGITLVAAAFATALLTRLARSAALRLSIVSEPRADRWSKTPTPLLGGVAIALGAAVAFSITVAVFGFALGSAIRAGLSVLTSAALMLAVGVFDDVSPLRPQVKLLFQVVAGVVLVSFGAILPVTPLYVVNVVVTLFWFVGVTNAFNLLDGLDGVAAGVAALGGFFLGLAFARDGAWLHAIGAWALGGAALGFLRYNFHPASIFMGDGGSLFIGAVLASLVASAPISPSHSLVSIIIVPILIVAVPILDTALVTVTRTVAGRAITQGGLDHSTYRLLALGLTERQTALLLCGFAFVGGSVGLLLMRLDHGLGMLIGATFLTALSLLAAYLGQTRVGYAGEPRGSRLIGELFTKLLYQRRMGEMLLDIALVAIAYYGAFRLRFDGELSAEYVAAFQNTVAWVIAARLVAFSLFGVYGGAWRYAGIVDVYRIIGAIVVSSAALFLVADQYVPPLARSHSIVYIDALLVAALILTSRLSFRSVEVVRRALSAHGEATLIYGAGDVGELVVRTLAVKNGTIGLRPVCFLDDDRRKQGARIHGIPVFGGYESLATAVQRFGVRKILIGTSKLSREIKAAVGAFGACYNLDVIEFDFTFLLATQARDQTASQVNSASTPRPEVVQRHVDHGSASSGAWRAVAQ